MITKIEGTRNGYLIDETSTGEEWNKIYSSYDNVRCIICNSNMFNNFRRGLLSNDIRVLNNKIPDNVVYINGVY